jgi:tRNA(Ile)-lysidine synthase
MDFILFARKFMGCAITCPNKTNESMPKDRRKYRHLHVEGMLNKSSANYLLNFIKSEDNLQGWQLERQSTVLAVSGGKDSMCLFHAFRFLNLPFVVAHVNFGLRGADSHIDELFVRTQCEMYGIPCFVHTGQTTRVATENNVSIQMAAREIRYAFFEEVRQQTNSAYIVTAHHESDFLEHFFIYLTRNNLQTAFRGLPMQNGFVIRPILHLSQKEMVSFIAENAIEWREDLSNQSTYYLRNKIRHWIIPELLLEWPDLAAEYVELVKLQLQLDNIMKPKFEVLWDSLEYAPEKWEIPLPIPERWEYWFLKQLKTLGFERGQIGDFLNEKSKSGAYFESINYAIFKDRNSLFVQNKNQHQQSIVLSPDMIPKLISWHGKPITIEWSNDQHPPKNEQIFLFSEDIFLEKVEIISWEKGQKMIPFGRKSHKKVSDLLVNAKWDGFKKRECAVIVSGAEVMGILGLKRSNGHLPNFQSGKNVKITLL